MSHSIRPCFGCPSTRPICCSPSISPRKDKGKSGKFAIGSLPPLTAPPTPDDNQAGWVRQEDWLVDSFKEAEMGWRVRDSWSSGGIGSVSL